MSPGVVTIASDMPGTIVDPLFLTDPDEAAAAASAAGRQAITTGFQQGITTLLGS